MKKLFTALLLLSLLAGCGGNAVPSEPSVSASPATLSGTELIMVMEHPVYAPSVTSCTYFIYNGTEKAVDFGEPYVLQYWKGGRWQDPQEDAAFTAIGYSLRPGETKALSCWLGGEREPGSYRLVKEVGGETLYAQFQLGKSLYTAENPYGFVSLEELDQVPNVPGAVSPEGEPGDLTEFVWKVGLDAPCQLRLVQENGGVTDIIYQNRHFLLRKLEEGQITQTHLSYLVTDGQDLLLSNWAAWEDGCEAAMIIQKADPELVQKVQDITEARLKGNSARFRVWSGDGLCNAMLTDIPTECGVVWQEPGKGSWGRGFDLQGWDGPETAILDLSWQEDKTLLVTCQTLDGGTSLLVFDPQSEQLYNVSAN